MEVLGNYGGNHFVIYKHQINKLYFLNLYDVICQLYRQSWDKECKVAKLYQKNFYKLKTLAHENLKW